jgi:SAM-dependent methyltransferase
LIGGPAGVTFSFFADMGSRFKTNIAYEIVRNSGYRIPAFRANRERRALAAGYDDEKDRAAYVEEVFAIHASVIRQCSPIKGTVLEIGPGGNLGVVLRFLDAGAERAVCLDVVPWAATKDHAELYDHIVGDSTPLYERIDYRCPEAIETTGLPDDSFDIIYSHACLEHVLDPAKAVASIGRLLKPGGVTSHQIDLRDHRDFSRPLEFLRYSDRVWKLAHSHTAFTNRWRRSDWAAAFADAGLDVISAASTHDERPELLDQERFHASFASRDVDDLACTGLLIAAQKPIIGER